MGPSGTDQLGPLAAVFADVYAEVRPASAAILGCATGNGLGAVDRLVTRRIVGVDINADYLEIARRRHARLGAALELVCADLSTSELEAGAFDLIFGALVFEHVDHQALAARIARWLAPRGVAAVVLQLQRDAEAPPVSRTAFPSLQALSGSIRLLAPRQARLLLASHGLEERRAWEIPLRGGKAFYVGLYGKADRGSARLERAPGGG